MVRMGKKRRGYRDRYFEDYSAKKVPADNRKGYKIIYEYTGFFDQWYDEQGHSKSFLKRRLALLELISLAAYIAASLQSSVMNTAALAAGFGVCAIVPWLAELAGSVMFLCSGEYVKELTRSEIDMLVQGGGFVRGALLLLSIIFGVMAAMRSGTVAVDYLVITGMILSAAISFMVALLHRRLYFRQYKNESGKPGKEI